MKFSVVRLPVIKEFSAILNGLNYEYVVIGGGACLVNGSGRKTFDLDIVVQNTRPVAEFLTNFEKQIQEITGDQDFYAVQGKNFYFKKHHIDIIPSNFSGHLYDITRHGVWNDNIRVLSIPELIKAKLAGLSNLENRAQAGKHETDAEDLFFLFDLVTVPLQMNYRNNNSDFEALGGYDNLEEMVEHMPTLQEYQHKLDHAYYVVWGHPRPRPC